MCKACILSLLPYFLSSLPHEPLTCSHISSIPWGLLVGKEVEGAKEGQLRALEKTRRKEALTFGGEARRSHAGSCTRAKEKQTSGAYMSMGSRPDSSEFCAFLSYHIFYPLTLLSNIQRTNCRRGLQGSPIGRTCTLPKQLPTQAPSPQWSLAGDSPASTRLG